MNAHQKIIKDNVRSILKIITNHYGVKYSAALYQILKEHPDFPSFLSFQYILHRMGKDSFAIHTSYEELTNMPAPFIVHGVTNVDLFLFITKATAESVQIIDEKGKEESIKKEQEKLKKLHKESLEKQDEISSVMKSTRSQMEEYETQISAEKDTTKALLNKINVQSDKINALIKQEKDEEAAQSQKPSVQTPKPDNTAKPENTTKPENKPAPEESKPETPQKPENNNNNSQENEDQNASGEKYLGKFKITAYCNGSCCSGHSSGLTASGTVPVQGRTVAMNGIPFGTKLKINGSVYTVEDRGVPYGHVDIYFESHEDAMEFGRMYADVYQVN